MRGLSYGKKRVNRAHWHRKLWQWLYENPKKGKDAWPEWYWNGGDKRDEDGNCCFACNAADARKPFSSDTCVYCPLMKRPANASPTLCLGGIFDKWDTAQTPRTRKKYAAIIRDMPWKQ